MIEDLNKCCEILSNNYNIQLHGTGIDLAAGNLWAIPYLLNVGPVDLIYCLEYSMHRLLNLGPAVLDHYDVPCEKTILVYGSFYHLHLENNSLDFCFLSQAFHHAEKPDELLYEIKRVLKPDGCVIIIGEFSKKTIIPYFKYFVKFFSHLILPKKIQILIFNHTLTVNKVFPTSEDLFPTNPILGDHYYTRFHYLQMFKQHGFIVKEVKGSKSSHKSFILRVQNKGSS